MPSLKPLYLFIFSLQFSNCNKSVPEFSSFICYIRLHNLWKHTIVIVGMWNLCGTIESQQSSIYNVNKMMNCLCYCIGSFDLSHSMMMCRWKTAEWLFWLCLMRCIRFTFCNSTQNTFAWFANDTFPPQPPLFTWI